jgi:serine/threonine protein kinase
MRRGRLAEEADVLEECASSRALTARNVTPMQSLSSCSAHPGAASSPFYSPRIEVLRELRSKLDNQLEIDVESSKSHWTELSVATECSDEQVPNSVVFEEMKKHPEWGLFFQDKQFELEIGAKIAEGGQAEIFEALGKKKYDASYSKYKRTSLVLKVFKKGYSLIDLQRSWPPGIASAAYPHRFPDHQIGRHSSYVCWAMGLHLMDDGRFAFIFDRHWGDLRKLTDEKMLERSGMECPPFDAYTTFMYIFSIAKGMRKLHELGILHNDLKAANVLVFDKHYKYTTIADFESSVGTVGTGFWRAPEILLALKNGNCSREPFTQKSDVYSFAMTCYEVITGRMPFEDHDRWDYDIVLRGGRPTMPGDPFSVFNILVTRCWHQDPTKRPSFAEIVEDLIASSRLFEIINGDFGDTELRWSKFNSKWKDLLSEIMEARESTYRHERWA